MLELVKISINLDEIQQVSPLLGEFVKVFTLFRSFSGEIDKRALELARITADCSTEERARLVMEDELLVAMVLLGKATCVQVILRETEEWLANGVFLSQSLKHESEKAVAAQTGIQ